MSRPAAAVGEAAGPLLGLAAVSVGVLLSSRGPGDDASRLLVALVLATAAGLSHPRRRAARRAAVLLSLALLAAVLSARAARGVRHSPFDSDAEWRRHVRLAAEVVTDPVPSRFATRVVLRARGAHVLATGTGDDSSRLAVLEAGDRVLVDVDVRPLEDTWWRWRHVAAEAVVDGLLDVRPPRSPLAAGANGVRRLVLARSASMAPTEAGVVAAFLVGDTRMLPPDVVDDFRRSGLGHLLVVSGSNVAFVLALAAPAWRRLPLGGRLAGGLAVLVLFGAVTRWEPSVLRAAVMASLALVASFVGRPAPGVRVLALAATGLLLADPFLLHSIGFLLSCGASAGILLLAQPLAARLRGPRWLREALATATAAQLGVAPVLLPAFGTVPLVTLPANVLAAPAAGVLTVCGLVSGVAGGLLSRPLPDVAALLQVPAALLARYVTAVAAVGAGVPGSLDARGAMLAALAALGAVAVASGRRLRPR